MHTTSLEQTHCLLEKLKTTQSSKEAELILKEAESLHIPHEIVRTIENEGIKLYQQQQFTEAQSYFQLLAALEPHVHKYWMQLGQVQTKLGLYDAAANAYSVAAISAPDDPLSLLCLAFCFAKLHNFEEAKRALDSAIIRCGNCAMYSEIKAEALTFYEILKKE